MRKDGFYGAYIGGKTMVVDMFKKKKNVTVDFHGVLSGDEWVLDCSCHELPALLYLCAVYRRV